MIGAPQSWGQAFVVFAISWTEVASCPWRETVSAPHSDIRSRQAGPHPWEGRGADPHRPRGLLSGGSSTPIAGANRQVTIHTDGRVTVEGTWEPLVSEEMKQGGRALTATLKEVREMLVPGGRTHNGAMGRSRNR